MVRDDTPTWLQLTDPEVGEASAPPWTPPSSRPSAWLWGPFPSPACSLVTSFLSCVTSSMHGQGTFLPSANLYFPICVLGPWERAVPRSPSLWPGHPPFSRQVSLPPTPAPCPPRLLILLPTWMLSPAHPHAALSLRVCRKLSELSPPFTPSSSRLVVRRVAPRGCGLVYTKLPRLHIPDGMLGQRRDASPIGPRIPRAGLSPPSECRSLRATALFSLPIGSGPRSETRWPPGF